MGGEQDQAEKGKRRKKAIYFLYTLASSFYSLTDSA